MFERPKTAESQLEVIEFVEKWARGKDRDLNNARRSMTAVDEEIAKRNARLEQLRARIAASSGVDAQIKEQEMLEILRQKDKLTTLRESVESKMNALIANLEDADEEIKKRTDSFKEHLN